MKCYLAFCYCCCRFRCRYIFFHINTFINKYTIANISTYITIINNMKFFNIINFNRVTDTLTLRREVRDGLEGRLRRRRKFLND